MNQPEFRFSVTDLGLFLGKSPVTIRGWERKGMLILPRVGVNRSLMIADVRDVARIAFQAGRISVERRMGIGDALGSLEQLQEEKF